jgi:capsid protein
MTISINIRTNVKEFERKVSAAAFKQIPFATAQALNAIAKQVIASEQKNEHAVLDRPRPFTTGAMTVRRATKVTMQATVFMRDITAAYLEPYEFGGRNKLNSKALLKPVEAVKDLDQFGNLPRNFLRKLKGRQDIFVGAVRTKAGVVHGVWQRDSSVDVELPLVTRTGKLRTPKARMNNAGDGRLASPQWRPLARLRRSIVSRPDGGALARPGAQRRLGSGGITRILDNVVGTHLRLSAMPDYRALALRFGIKAFDATWADEFRGGRGAVAQLRRRPRAAGTTCHAPADHRPAVPPRAAPQADRRRQRWFVSVLAARAHRLRRRRLRDGVPAGRPGPAVQPVPADGHAHLRGGVEIDDDGVPIAYHIRKAEQNDWYNAIESMHLGARRARGRRRLARVIHDFDRDRAGQHRGIGVFTPVLAHMKMLARYYGVELQQATIAATFGTYVTSPYDPALVQDALGGDGRHRAERLPAACARDWAKGAPCDGQRRPRADPGPGEKIVSVASAHPHSNFGDFAHEMLRVRVRRRHRRRAGHAGLVAQTNYSSARAALMEAWKTLMRRRHQFTSNTATPMYALAARGDGARRAAAARRRARFRRGVGRLLALPWLGPARGWVDPTKEPQGQFCAWRPGSRRSSRRPRSRAWTGKKSSSSARSSRRGTKARRAAAEVGQDAGRRTTRSAPTTRRTRSHRTQSMTAELSRTWRSVCSTCRWRSRPGRSRSIMAALADRLGLAQLMRPPARS